MTALYHPETDAIALAPVLHALSDPQRLSIVRELSASPEPLQCGALHLDISKSTRTHHFRVLREAGVIRQEVLGTSRYTTLRRDDLDARFPGLLDAVLAAAPAEPVPA